MRRRQKVFEERGGEAARRTSLALAGRRRQKWLVVR